MSAPLDWRKRASHGVDGKGGGDGDMLRRVCLPRERAPYTVGELQAMQAGGRAEPFSASPEMEERPGLWPSMGEG